MADKSTVNLIALQKNIQQSLKKPESKETCLSFEYKLLLLYSARTGIYVMPQLDTLDIWHGIIFVRFGIFKDARYKFKMTFENFPKKPPTIILVSEVYHPLINSQSGLLDLGEELQKNWNYGSEHLIYTIVQRIKVIFLDPKHYEVTDSYNKEAGELYKSSPDQFFRKVRQSVQNSKNTVYNNYPQSSLKFMPFNQKHKKIKDNLSQICEDQTLTAQQKKKKFMKILKQ